MNDVKYSYNSYTMNEPSIIMGKAVLEDEAYFQETRKKIIETREWFKEEMKKLGFSFADSMANFIFATHKTVPAEELFAEAKKNKIYVRYFKKSRIDNYLRITIGTREEMEALLQFFKDYIKQKIETKLNWPPKIRFKNLTMGGPLFYKKILILFQNLYKI